MDRCSRALAKWEADMMIRWQGKFYLTFRPGDIVVDRADPRHQGRVVLCKGLRIGVRWENGWLSEMDARHLILAHRHPEMEFHR